MTTMTATTMRTPTVVVLVGMKKMTMVPQAMTTTEMQEAIIAKMANKKTAVMTMATKKKEHAAIWETMCLTAAQEKH